MIKTYEGWNCNLDEYLEIGDLVDEEMAEYFLNVLPPACQRKDCIQMGEPHNHINGRATYATLKWTEDGWMFVGNCHRGETEQP